MGAASVIAVQPQSLYIPRQGIAGARVGVFSAANYAEDLTAGRGPELNVNERVFGLYIWRAGATNNQGLWRFGNLALTGWGLIGGTTRDTRLFCRPSAASTNLTTPTYFGPYHLVIRVTSVTPTLRCSVNGGASFDLALPAAYVAAGTLAVHSLGKWQSEAAFPAVNSSILAAYVIDGYSGGVTTDANIEYLSGSKFQYDCWRARPEVYNHANLVMLFDPNAWDGTAGGDYALAGSGGYVMRMQGTGGGKTTMPQYDRQRIPLKAIHGNAYNDYYERGVFRRSVFSFPKFDTDALDTANGPTGLLIGAYGKNLNIVGNANIGLNASGVNLIGNNIAVEMDVFDSNESQAAPGIGAGTKTIILTEGIHAISGTEDKPNASPQFLIYPHTATITYDNAYATVTDITAFGFDSLLEQVASLTDISGIKGPQYDAAVMLQRAALVATRKVVCEGWGTGTWFERINTASGITTYVSQWKKLCIGTTSNHIRIQLGTNDYGLNTYLLQTTFQTNLGDFFTALFAAGITGLKLQLFGTTARVNEAVANPSGWILQDFRDSINTAVTTFANANCTYVDAIGAVAVGNRPDGLHYNTAGHLEWSNFATANPP